MTDYPLAIPQDGIVRLATDLALELRTPAESFAEWGIGLPGQDPRADAIMENTAFREIYSQIQREWDGVTGTTPAGPAQVGTDRRGGASCHLQDDHRRRR